MIVFLKRRKSMAWRLLNETYFTSHHNSNDCDCINSVCGLVILQHERVGMKKEHLKPCSFCNGEIETWDMGADSYDKI